MRLFAHRGFVKNIDEENSIKSLKQAYDSNFTAIEFDIWFLNGEFILKHNKPKKSEFNILPRLKDYFLFKDKLFYWMDFKNLDENNIDKALILLKKEIFQSSIDLNKIYFAPFLTNRKKSVIIFDKFRIFFGENVNLVAVCEKLGSKIRLKNFLNQNKIKFLSIYHKLIDKNFVKNFSEITIFAWTVNDLSRLQELQELGISNFATDKITPKIMSINNVRNNKR